jgi:hypothetical protein
MPGVCSLRLVVVERAAADGVAKLEKKADLEALSS